MLALLLIAALPRPALAQQGATEVDEVTAPRKRPEAPARNAPQRDISAELSAAQAAFDAQDWPKAHEWLRKARAKAPGNVEVLNLLGFSQRKMGDLKDALVSFQAVLRQVPGHRSAHEQLGKTYLELGQYEDARRALDQLRKVCPAPCAEAGELDEALRSLRR